MRLSLTPTTALDLIAGSDLAILAAVPVGLIGAANTKGKILEPVLAGLEAAEILRGLELSVNRLNGEIEATGSLCEALAVILDERVRVGSMRFDELLVHFAVPTPDGSFRHHLISAPTALVAAAAMLDQAGTFAKDAALEGE